MPVLEHMFMCSIAFIPLITLQGACALVSTMQDQLERFYMVHSRDGRVDIGSSQSDALASLANFFKNAGWKAGVSWGVAARVPATFDRAAVRNNVVAARCTRVFARHSRWLTMREWRALGVVPTGRTLPDDEPASLLEPDGPTAPAYLLTSNYRVILEYNCSNFYALSVGLLADAIARR